MAGQVAFWLTFAAIALPIAALNRAARREEREEREQRAARRVRKW
jgi:hypothetical protein